MEIKLKFKEAFIDVAIRCDDGCPITIHGKYIKCDVGSGFTQNYREPCAKKIQKKIDDGFVFARRKPDIILVSSKPFGIAKEGSEEDRFNVRLMDGTLITISRDKLEKNYQIL